ncbi:MAG TPA: hypothetical protein VGR39_01570, partial [Candidatus Acidoferrales bacterium]|nr:hypothetical protein [Candidatus Acidoferrales bacterium]
ELDTRSDLFSFGAILYEMATGQPAFPGNTPAVIFDNILNRMPVAPSELNPNLPPKLEEIIGKSLEKDRDLRYQTAAEMRGDLKRLKRDTDSSRVATPISGSQRVIVSGSGAQQSSGGFSRKSSTQIPADYALPQAEITAPRKSLRWNPPSFLRFLWEPRWYFARVIVGLLLFAIFVGIHYWDHYHPVRTSSSFQQMTISRLTTSGDVGPATISPDGKWLAYVVNAKQQSLWVRQLATGSTAQVLPPGSANYNDGDVTFSRDGNYLYCVVQLHGNHKGILEKVPSLGGEPQQILSDIDSPISLSPDGNQFVFVRNSGQAATSSLMLANSDGSNIRDLATVHNPATFSTEGPAWSPDGKRIAVGFLGGGFLQHATLETVAVADGKATPLGNSKWNQLRQIAWLPDGSAVVFAGSKARESTFNSQVWQVSYPGAQERRITNDLNFYVDTSVTADGTGLVTIQAVFRSSLWLMPGKISKLTKASPREITSDPERADGFMGAAWTPKSDIIYGYYTSGQVGLAKLSVATGSSQDLNTGSNFNAGPSACGGTNLFVFSVRDQVWRADDDGGSLKQLTSGSGNVFPACSPDGKTVFYNHIDQGKSMLWRMGLDGQNAAQVGDKHYNAPEISPDGRRVAVYDWEDARESVDLIILDAATGAVQSTIPMGGSLTLGEGQTRMAWAPDGRSIVYIKDDPVSGVSNLWEQPVGASGSKPEPPKQVTNFTAMHIWSFAWSPDGKQLVLARGNTSAGAVLISHFH